MFSPMRSAELLETTVGRCRQNVRTLPKPPATEGIFDTAGTVELAQHILELSATWLPLWSFMLTYLVVLTSLSLAELGHDRQDM